MPSRQAIELAVPYCWRRRIVRDGQHGIHVTCFTPMRYSALHNAWRCPSCEAFVGGPDVAARQTMRRTA